MRALEMYEYEKIVNIIRRGFKYDFKTFKPNERLATIFILQTNLGLRIGDILQLKVNSIVKDGFRYRFDIIEEKTNKRRTFTVPVEIYQYILEYAKNNNIGKDDLLFNISARAVQKQLKIVCQYLKLKNVSTHSFRKLFATNIYVNNDCNLALVKELLQHSDMKTTQRYIGMSSKLVEDAISKNVYIIK